mmetsp:Transcript_85379/g.241834  ORF Transcript_85379/g.241834 Transcript_85379/m.241834 type:complete len:267 (-) Transcript_85379:176-976(-)
MATSVRVVFKMSKYRRVGAAIGRKMERGKALTRLAKLEKARGAVLRRFKQLERQASDMGIKVEVGSSSGWSEKAGSTLSKRIMSKSRPEEEKVGLLLQDEGDDGDDGDEFDAAENEIQLRIAVRSLLTLVASEASEIVSSIWIIIMAVIFYHSPNKHLLFVFDKMTGEQLERALTFSVLDAFLESVTFVTMIVFLALSVELEAATLTLQYIRNMELYTDIFFLGVTISGIGSAFLLMHFGVDPALVSFDSSPTGGGGVVGNQTAEG